MAESQNVLRGRKSKAPVIYTAVICGLFGLAFIFYATYAYLGYIRLHNITDPGITDIMDAMGTLFTEDSLKLPITFEVIQEVLVMQVRDIWWVYVGIALAVFLMVTSRSQNDFRGMEHGSARWSNNSEKELFTDNTGIPCADNFYITVTNPNNKYYATDNLHELVIGGSGAGKSFRKIKPDIIQMTGSYVITDPSGELYRDTANFLKNNGYQVKVLNLNNINLTNTYNPFSYMSSAQDVLEVAELFCKASAGEGEKADFWSGAAQDLLVMIMVYLWNTESEIKSFGRVLRLINSIKYNKDRKLEEECELAQCVNRYINEKESHRYDTVAVNWDGIKGVPEDTMMSIVKTMSVRLRLWSVEDVDILTEIDEMGFDDIGVNKTALFVIIPGASSTYRAVANMFYTQLFKRLIYVAETKYENCLPLLVSLELDEFANIGLIPDFRATLATVRKYNIRICIVLQSLSQIKSLYEKDWNDIVNNCAIKTLLGADDKETCEFFSEKIGETTIVITHRSRNRGNQGGGSDSEQSMARRLLKTDEIPKALAKGKRGKCIVFAGVKYKFYLDKFDTLKHPRISEVGSNRGKNRANNANIIEDYTKINAERKKRYEEERRKMHKISEALANGEYSKSTSFEQNQAIDNFKKLKDLFESSNSTMMSFNDAVILPDDDLSDIEDG